MKVLLTLSALCFITWFGIQLYRAQENKAWVAQQTSQSYEAHNKRRAINQRIKKFGGAQKITEFCESKYTSAIDILNCQSEIFIGR